jgi:hypothetical protein
MLNFQIKERKGEREERERERERENKYYEKNLAEEK